MATEERAAIDYHLKAMNSIDTQGGMDIVGEEKEKLSDEYRKHEEAIRDISPEFYDMIKPY